MPEMAAASHGHRYSGSIGSLDHLLVADRTTRLDNRGYSSGDRSLDSVGEREKSVTGQHRPDRTLLRFSDRDANTLQSIWLTAPDPENGLIAGEHDGIGFHQRRCPPGESEIVQFSGQSGAAASRSPRSWDRRFLAIMVLNDEAAADRANIDSC